MVKAPCNLCRTNEIEALQKLRALKAGQRELRGVIETLVISTKATHHFPHGPFFIQILLSGDNHFTEGSSHCIMHGMMPRQTSLPYCSPENYTHGCLQRGIIRTINKCVAKSAIPASDNLYHTVGTNPSSQLGAHRVIWARASNHFVLG